MLVKIKYYMDAPSEEVIDLADYGYEFDTSWDDLIEEQRNVITDEIAEQYCVTAGGEEIIYKDNIGYYEESYNEEEILIIEKKFNK